MGRRTVTLLHKHAVELRPSIDLVVAGPRLGRGTDCGQHFGVLPGQNFVLHDGGPLGGHGSSGTSGDLGSGVVDVVAAVLHGLQNRCRLPDQVDLESHMVLNFVGVFLVGQGDNRDEVNERHAIFPEVHHVCLALLIGRQARFDVGDRFWTVVALGTLLDVPIGGLQKATAGGARVSSYPI